MLLLTQWPSFFEIVFSPNVPAFERVSLTHTSIWYWSAPGAHAACKVWIWWVVPFFQKQWIIKKKKKNPLKPDNVIVMSSNVHEFKGKPRFIVWYQCLMQQIIKNKVTPHDRQYSHLSDFWVSRSCTSNRRQDRVQIKLLSIQTTLLSNIKHLKLTFAIFIIGFAFEWYIGSWGFTVLHCIE